MRRSARAVCLAAGALVAGVVIVKILLGFREDARKRQCANNLRQLGLGFSNYHEIFGTFPPGTLPNPSLPPDRRLSWVVAAWSFVGDGQIHLNIDRTRGWDDPANRRPTGYSTVDGPSSTSEVHFPACPDVPRAATNGHSRLLSYVGIAGLGQDAPVLPKGHPRAGVFGYDRVTRLSDIVDGASNTMMVAETAQGNGPWTAGGPTSVRGLDPSRQPYLGKGRRFGGTHRGGANVLFADGAVRFVRERVSPEVFENLSTIFHEEPTSQSY